MKAETSNTRKDSNFLQSHIAESVVSVQRKQILEE